MTRGKSVEVEPQVWVAGAALQNYILKWVHSDAVRGEQAHLLDGFVHNRADDMLEEIQLDAYMGRRPEWWPFGDPGWELTPNNSKSTSFWASVCASACFRSHRFDVEIVTVDLQSTPAKCQCYKYTDPSGKDHNASHASPSDVQLMQWFHSSTRIGDSENRSLIATYAVHPHPGRDHYVAGLLSTVYYDAILPPEYQLADPDYHAEFQSHAATLELCLDEATLALSSTIGFVQFKPATAAFPISQCGAGTRKYDGIDSGNLWLPAARRPGEQYGTVYRTRYCDNVRAGSDRSLVYSKTLDAWCPGVPVAAGFTLASTPLSSAATSEADTTGLPFDLRCRKQCLEDELCQMAHVFVPTFSYQCAACLEPPHPPPFPHMVFNWSRSRSPRRARSTGCQSPLPPPPPALPFWPPPWSRRDSRLGAWSWP